MKPVISVKNISKQYVLGSEAISGQTFREMLQSVLIAPFRRIKRLRGVDQQQTKFWALNDVSFDVNAGEVVGIVGLNGAGKSTLLKVLSRITTPTKGEIEYQGRLASLLEVGTGFHPELTGRENIYLNGAILGMTRSEISARLDEIVAFAEIGKFLDTPVKRYSSGMYVRLAFSVAAHLEPDILIIDEVLSVGDTKFQNKCIGKMKSVSEQGRTVLFISHNLAAVSRLCDRGIWLADGQIKMDDDIANVINAYENYSLQAVASSEQTAIAANNDIAVLSINVRATQGFKDQQIIAGAGCEFQFRVSTHLDLNNFGIAIGIYDQSGHRLCFMDSAALSQAQPLSSGEWLLSCTAESLPLVAGRYSINFAICEGDVLLLAAERASIFYISNPGASVADQSKDAGPVLINYQWQVDQPKSAPASTAVHANK